MADDRLVALTRDGLYRDAVKWLESKGGTHEWTTLPNGSVRCTVTVGNVPMSADVGGGDEAARQNAFIHAVDELQNS